MTDDHTDHGRHGHPPTPQADPAPEREPTNWPWVALGTAVALAAAVTLVAPDLTRTYRSVSVAVSLAAIAATWATAIPRPHSKRTLIAIAVMAATAIALLAAPMRWATWAGRGIATVAVVFGAWDFLSRRPTQGRELWVLFRTTAVVAGAGLLLAFPHSVIAYTSVIMAAAWLAMSAVVVWAAATGNATRPHGYLGALARAADWYRARPDIAANKPELYSTLLFEGVTASTRVAQFLSLMAFSTLIAAMGVVTDSTAVVIGAMLAAPLMTPLMGMSLSLVMGWPGRLRRITILTFAGIGTTLMLSVGIGFALRAAVTVSTNSQIVSRAAPTLLDLLTAVAAGAAGAYGFSRSGAVSSLSGVAVAISLVPPLAVCGICLAQGDWSQAQGSALLFATNAVAIVVVGGLVFVTTGVAPLRRVAASQHRVRTYAAAVATISAVVLAGLIVNSQERTAGVFERATVREVTEQWLEATPQYRLDDATVDGDVVLVTVAGPEQGLGDHDTLAKELASHLHRPIRLDLRLTVERRFVATSG